MRLSRLYYAGISAIVSVLFITLLHVTFMVTKQDGLAKKLIGLQQEKEVVISVKPGSMSTERGENLGGMPYPLSIHNIMWIIFFLTLGELLYRHQESKVARSYLQKKYLPGDDDNIVLQPGELTPIFSKVKLDIRDGAAFLPRLVHQAIIQFENSHSIDQAANLVNSNMELISHELELRYNILRYLVWLIPTLGFIGTVYGISEALNNISTMDPKAGNLLSVATGSLAIAFDTTLLALLQSAVLVCMLHIIQEKEELVLNLSGKDCLNNLINRLYVHRGE